MTGCGAQPESLAWSRPAIMRTVEMGAGELVSADLDRVAVLDPCRQLVHAEGVDRTDFEQWCVDRELVGVARPAELLDDELQHLLVHTHRAPMSANQSSK